MKMSNIVLWDRNIGGREITVELGTHIANYVIKYIFFNKKCKLQVSMEALLNYMSTQLGK